MARINVTASGGGETATYNMELRSEAQIRRKHVQN